MLQDPRDFVNRPNVVLPLFPLAVCIERGEKESFFARHFSHQPVDKPLGGPRKNLCEAWLQFRADPYRHGEVAQHQGVVVKHLLKMGKQPLFIRRVAMKSTSDMVMYSAKYDASKR